MVGESRVDPVGGAVGDYTAFVAAHSDTAAARLAVGETVILMAPPVYPY